MWHPILDTWAHNLESSSKRRTWVTHAALGSFRYFIWMGQFPTSFSFSSLSPSAEVATSHLGVVRANVFLCSVCSRKHQPVLGGVDRIDQNRLCWHRARPDWAQSIVLCVWGSAEPTVVFLHSPAHPPSIRGSGVAYKVVTVTFTWAPQPCPTAAPILSRRSGWLVGTVSPSASGKADPLETLLHGPRLLCGLVATKTLVHHWDDSERRASGRILLSLPCTGCCWARRSDLT